MGREPKIQLPPAEVEQPNDFIVQRSGTVIACIIGAMAIVLVAAVSKIAGAW